MPCLFKEVIWKMDNKSEDGFRCTGDGKAEFKQRGIVIDGISPIKHKGYPQPENYGDKSEIYIASQDVFYFPRGFDKFFTHLVMLRVTLCRLREIKQDDLKVFPDLIYLDLDSNYLEVIEKDLFKFNPKIETILMDFNLIKFIDANFLDDLKDLKFITLAGSACINIRAETREKILTKLRKEIQKSCQNHDELENLAKINKTGTKHGRYFWVMVGCGVIVGIFLIGAVIRVAYGIIKRV
ncbi:unnamed protein product [Chironomus riparius]|uniref:Uncharacterized protein n=1 Tax=Chironomus riparius TaxID=315576 RepID=A0A9N9WXS6_9DIPT|nr:unnamed protein product [Chironomus riparius]